MSLREITTAARRGRELVRQILAFSRQQPSARTEVDMAQIVNDACALLRAGLPPSVRLVQCTAPQVPTVLADATQLGQVLVNLGTNALHAMQGRAGQIEFCLDTVTGEGEGVPVEMREHSQPDSRLVRLRVIDSGCGMAEGVRERIFDPFFTTKPVGQGTGLGLPVVLGIMQTHGGAIEVHSVEGVGTTMTLYLRACSTNTPGEGTIADEAPASETTPPVGLGAPPSPPSQPSLAMPSSCTWTMTIRWCFWCPASWSSAAFAWRLSRCKTTPWPPCATTPRPTTCS